MSKRAVNIFAGMVSLFLIVLYVFYAIYGAPYGVTFIFPTILAIATTYTMLSVHQTFVAVHDGGRFRPFTHPIPFGWVLAITYISFTLLLWWVILDYFVSMPFHPFLVRFVWLQSALAHIWFFRRFVFWSLPPETRDARDIRQQATQDLLDETSYSLAETGKINAARNQKISLKGVELDERIMKLADSQRIHDAVGADQAATGVLQDATDVRQGEREHDLDVRQGEGL